MGIDYVHVARTQSLPCLRWRTICGACCAPTGRQVYCERCGAALCPRHTKEQCACINMLD